MKGAAAFISATAGALACSSALVCAGFAADANSVPSARNPNRSWSRRPPRPSPPRQLLPRLRLRPNVIGWRRRPSPSPLMLRLSPRPRSTGGTRSRSARRKSTPILVRRDCSTSSAVRISRTRTTWRRCATTGSPPTRDTPRRCRTSGSPTSRGWARSRTTRWLSSFSTRPPKWATPTPCRMSVRCTPAAVS